MKSVRGKNPSDLVKKGDNNTRFYHRIANSIGRNNFFARLCTDGYTNSDQEAINDTIIQFYMNLFNEIVQWCPKLDGLEFPFLDYVEANWLERPFQEGVA